MGTINHGLKVVRHILNLAAGEWIDGSGLSWLVAAPKIKLIPDQNKRKPSPFTWEEQDRLFRELPRHLASMALFAVNSGCRDSEVCRLRWDWEARVPELDTSIFILPEQQTKNGQERIIVLNRIARSLVDSLRGQHPEYSAGSCYQDRLRHGCRGRAYRDILTACLENSFQHYMCSRFGVNRSAT